MLRGCAGIMPIQTYGGFKRMCGFCKVKVPQDITDTLESIKDNDEAVKKFGVDLGVKMCRCRPGPAEHGCIWGRQLHAAAAEPGEGTHVRRSARGSTARCSLSGHDADVCKCCSQAQQHPPCLAS